MGNKKRKVDIWICMYMNKRVIKQGGREVEEVKKCSQIVVKFDVGGAGNTQ